MPSSCWKAGRTRQEQSYNLKLGERRIEAVRHYLVVKEYRFTDPVVSAQKPVAENKIAKAARKSRRGDDDRWFPRYGNGSVIFEKRLNLEMNIDAIDHF
jgi:hypothetical protein